MPLHTASLTTWPLPSMQETGRVAEPPPHVTLHLDQAPICQCGWVHDGAAAVQLPDSCSPA